MAPRRSTLQLPSRRGAYTLIIGVIIGMLAAGLGIPFIFGTPLDNVGPAGVSSLGGSAPTPLGGGATTGTAAASSSATTIAGQSASGGGSGSALLGVSPAAGGGPGVAGGPTDTAPGGTRLTASDRGVTPTTISIAFTIADLGGVSKLGFAVPGYDPKAQETFDSTFVNNINSHGGVYGRKIVPLYFTYDPTNEQSEQAACLSATQDHAIFAAIDSGGGLSFTAQLCFLQQNHTPLIGLGSFGTPQDMYRQAAGLLFTVYPSGIRSLANAAVSFVDQGLLKGKKIGILDRDFPGTVQTVKDGMVATLKQLGYDVAYRVDMSTDDGTAASQIPVAVQQMQAHGVNAVMLLTDFITGTEFVQSADKSAYRPQYYESDFESNTNDTAVQAMPASFQAFAITTSRVGEWRVGTPEPAIDAACRKVYAAATGVDPKRSDNAYEGQDVACGLVDLLARGLQNAGPNPTRAAYAAGLQQIGSIPYPFYGGFSYRPGKFDGADPIRTLVYHQPCSCWMPVGSFTDPKY